MMQTVGLREFGSEKRVQGGWGDRCERELLRRVVAKECWRKEW
jgi:hypothetical protein